MADFVVGIRFNTATAEAQIAKLASKIRSSFATAGGTGGISSGLNKVTKSTQEANSALTAFGLQVPRVLGGAAGAVGGFATNVAKAFRVAFTFTFAYNALRLLEGAFSAFFAEITSGIKKLDEFRLSAIKAAGFLQLRALEPTTESFKQFLEFTSKTQQSLEILGASALATGEQINRVFRELTQRGLIPETEQDLRTIVDLAQAVALAAGDSGDATRQFTTEITALLEGQARASAELLRSLDRIRPGFKEAIKNAKTAREVYDLLRETLKGFNETIEAGRDTLYGASRETRTLLDVIERLGAEQTFGKLVKFLKEFNESLRDPATGEFTARARQIQRIIENIFKIIEQLIFNFARLSAVFLIVFGDDNQSSAKQFSNTMGEASDNTTKFINNLEHLTQTMQRWGDTVDRINTGLSLMIALIIAVAREAGNLARAPFGGKGALFGLMFGKSDERSFLQDIEDTMRRIRAIRDAQFPPQGTPKAGRQGEGFLSEQDIHDRQAKEEEERLKRIQDALRKSGDEADTASKHIQSLQRSFAELTEKLEIEGYLDADIKGVQNLRKEFGDLQQKAQEAQLTLTQGNIDAFNDKIIADYNSELIKVAKNLSYDEDETKSLIQALSVQGDITADQIDLLKEAAKAQTEYNKTLDQADLLEQFKDLPFIGKGFEEAARQMKNNADAILSLRVHVKELSQEEKNLEDAISAVNKAYDDAVLTEQAIANIRAKGLAPTKDIVEAEKERLEILKQIQEIEDPAKRRELEDKNNRAAAIAAENDKIIDDYERLKKTLTKLSSEIADSMREAFSDFFFDALTGELHSFTDVWKSFLNSLAKIFSDFLATFTLQALKIPQILDKILDVNNFTGLGGVGGGGGGGGGGFGGGFLNSIIGGIGSLFSAGGSALGSGTSVAAFGADAFLTDIPASLELGGGFFSGIGGFLSAAVPYIGAAVAAISFAIPIISKLFEKDPEISIDIGRLNSGIEDRVATVQDFFDITDFGGDFAKDLITIHKGKSGLADNPELREAIAGVITGTVEQIQAIINQLPSELADQLNEQLLNTPLDFAKESAPDKIIHKYLSGKKVAEKFQQYLQSGALSAEFIASIRDFFGSAYEQIGVSAEAAQKIIDDYFEKINKIPSGAKGFEERGKVGQEFLAQFQAFVDVFNILNGYGKDSFQTAIDNVKQLSNELGIVSDTEIPDLSSIHDALQALFEAGEITPETAQKFADLRNAIVQLTFSLAQAVTTIVGFIQQLNSDIIALGGSGVSLIDPLRQSIGALIELEQNQNLTLEERQQILQELNNEANQLTQEFLAANRAAVQPQIDALNAELAVLDTQRQAISAQINALNSQKSAISERISALGDEKKAIQDAANERLDALKEELKIAQGLANLVDDINKTIQDLLLSSQSIDNVFQRLDFAQSEIDRLSTELAGASEADKEAIGRQILDLLNSLQGLNTEAFQQPSLQYRDQFRSVIMQLEDLRDAVGPVRSVEEINAEIEEITKQMEADLASIDARISALNAQSASIDARIASLQNQSAALDSRRNEIQEQIAALNEQANTLTEEQMEELRAIKEFIRMEALDILQTRLDQLNEVTASLGEQQLTTTIIMSNEIQRQTPSLDRIAQATFLALGSRKQEQIVAAQYGYEGIVNKPTLFLAGEGGFPEMVNISPATSHGGDGNGNLTLSVDNSIVINGSVGPKEVKQIEENQKRIEQRIINLLKFNKTLRKQVGLE